MGIRRGEWRMRFSIASPSSWERSPEGKPAHDCVAKRPSIAAVRQVPQPWLSSGVGRSPGSAMRAPSASRRPSSAADACSRIRQPASV